MPSIRRCYLCNYKYDSQNSNIMMHSFPLCEQVKSQWIKVCDVLPTDKITNLYICSKHFQVNDFYKPHSSSTKYRLKNGAVPSRKAVNTVGVACDFETEVGEMADTITSTSSSSFDGNI